MSENISYGSNEIARMHAMATVLGSHYVQQRNAYIKATRENLPVSINPTPEADLFSRSCGEYNIMWHIGNSIVTAYIDTAFPDIKQLLTGGARDAVTIMQPPRIYQGRIGRLHARFQEKKDALGGALLRDILKGQAKVSSPYIQCLTVEKSAPEAPHPPKTLHSQTCASTEAQFMRAGCRGEEETLAEMCSSLERIGSGVHSTTLQAIYMPPILE